VKQTFRTDSQTMSPSEKAAIPAKAKGKSKGNGGGTKKVGNPGNFQGA
jgi:hypothetical protein